jgi:hypothetical protein
MYWRNTLHLDGMQDGTVKHTGWKWEIGASTKYFDFFRRHHSRHLLDEVSSIDSAEGAVEGRARHYPLEDSYGIRVKFYTSEHHR